MATLSRILRALSLSVLAVVGLSILVPKEAVAQWTNVGHVNGIQVYRDERTGLEWTQTIGQVQSSGWGGPARALVARYGFRLPSFRELQVMEANGGFGRLKIRTSMSQYYETINSNILGAAWGNGFRTPQQRKGVGMNWVIGVREPVIVEEEGFVQPTVSKPAVATSTVSKPPIATLSNGSSTGLPNVPAATSNLPNWSDFDQPDDIPTSLPKPSSGSLGIGSLPTRPDYD